MDPTVVGEKRIPTEVGDHSKLIKKSEKEQEKWKDSHITLEREDRGHF